jgi:dihydropteroate synthase
MLGAVGRPVVMGVLNVTPDSFSDGGRFCDRRAAVTQGRALAAAGADVVDVGGESSRPGATPVPLDEELARVVPVVAELAGTVPRISVDTVKPEVARAAVAAGASLVNDVSGRLGPVAAELGVGWVAMHRQGTPADMQDDPRYDDVVAEVAAAVLAAADEAARAGCPEVLVDPGIGFGKTAEHNLALLAHLDALVGPARARGYGVLVGTSRKRFLGPLAAGPGRPPAPPEGREVPSLATAVWAMTLGATVLRVHDPGPARQAAGLVGPFPVGEAA